MIQLPYDTLEALVAKLNEIEVDLHLKWMLLGDRVLDDFTEAYAAAGIPVTASNMSEPDFDVINQYYFPHRLIYNTINRGGTTWLLFKIQPPRT